MTARRRLALLATGLVVLAGVSAGLTYAFWSTEASASVGIVRSGNLDLQLVGAPTYTETSPGVTPHGIALRNDGRTIEHLATPGDGFVMSQQFRALLDGDNIRARMTVTWETPPSFPTGVSGTYRVTSSTGASSGETPLGTALTLPGTPANISAPSSTWTLTVTLTWGGQDVVVQGAPTATTPTTYADLGRFHVDLRQVRDGDGFRS
ncbi:hypothetical protein AB6N23_01065 [Cellulomonas sp. 179-A 9B4 NHS]|uniref:hypothetical protein n=1 Tax=Cellulomonas sp. 179-A 9B4 NHS TaxID=3142379 RepID=UPI0039A2D4CA